MVYWVYLGYWVYWVIEFFLQRFSYNNFLIILNVGLLWNKKLELDLPLE